MGNLIQKMDPNSCWSTPHFDRSQRFFGKPCYLHMFSACEIMLYLSKSLCQLLQSSHFFLLKSPFSGLLQTPQVHGYKFCKYRGMTSKLPLTTGNVYLQNWLEQP